jgi:hypothetical protein
VKAAALVLTTTVGAVQRLEQTAEPVKAGICVAPGALVVWGLMAPMSMWLDRRRADHRMGLVRRASLAMR